MRRFGQFFMGLGAAVGALVALAAFAHLGLAGVPWLVNVALAKLGALASVASWAAGHSACAGFARALIDALAAEPCVSRRINPSALCAT
jgi:hypothetical protein